MGHVECCVGTYLSSVCYTHGNVHTAPYTQQSKAEMRARAACDGFAPYKDLRLALAQRLAEPDLFMKHKWNAVIRKLRHDIHVRAEAERRAKVLNDLRKGGWDDRRCGRDLKRSYASHPGSLVSPHGSFEEKDSSGRRRKKANTVNFFLKGFIILHCK